MTSTLPATSCLLAELEREAVATRQLLDAVPGDRLDWRPHERSFSLGQLARHIAEIPGTLVGMLQGPSVDFGASAGGTDQPAAKAEVTAAFEQGLEQARRALAAWTEDELAADWPVFLDGRRIMEPTRAEALRAFLFNHLYHHRGQLGVYLRLLDVPVPSVYGPTADINPFEE